MPDEYDPAGGKSGREINDIFLRGCPRGESKRVG
jgi:hypothetical protein